MRKLLLLFAVTLPFFVLGCTEPRPPVKKGDSVKIVFVRYAGDSRTVSVEGTVQSVSRAGIFLEEADIGGKDRFDVFVPWDEVRIVQWLNEQ